MAGQIVTGFSDMHRRSEQRQSSNTGGDFIRYINLRDDGDMVLFRLVTESDKQYAEQSGVTHLFIQGEFHREEGKTKSGKTYFRDVLCSMSFNEGSGMWEGECKHCEDPDNKSRTQFFAWAYVYAFYHKQQDRRYIPGDASTDKFKRKQIRRGTEAYFKEEVNQYCIWQDGWFMLQLIQGKVARFGVLCDRDYMVTRHGVARSSSTRRVLEDMAPTPISEEIREGANDLPTLASVASNEVRTLGGRKEEEKRAPDVINLDELPDELSIQSLEGSYLVSVEDIDAAASFLSDLSMEDDGEDSLLNPEVAVTLPDELDAIFGDLESMADTPGEVENE